MPYQIDAAKTLEYGFLESYTHPDMETSLAITSDLYSSFHFGMNKLRDAIGRNTFWKRLVYYGGVAVGDFLFYLLPVPTGYFWMHESFHRAGFTHMGLRSHINFAFPNGAYTMADTGGSIYKYDLPRTIEAGMESEFLLVEKMQKNNFFYDQGMFNEFLYWLANLQAWGYAYMPFQNDESTMVVEGKEQEVSADSLQWAYYLFHPEEKYIADSENDEVIGISDLKDSEKEFLKNRVMWSLVNFASPMMFGIRSIPLGAGFSGNFALRQFYTSFGTDISVNVYLKKAPFNLAFSYHSYINYEHYFPAIEAELVDFPVQFTPKFGLFISPRILLGMQPRNQEFMTGAPEFFALAGCRADFAVSRHFLPYLELSAKTDGWVAGNEFLERNISVKAGISVRF
ncbi:MAG: hypothetical protein LBK05_08110 [Treponema sp.]|nr:hypothetical protein [Treponema sp.]